MNTNPPLSAFEEWYRSLKIVKANGGPANGTIAATLVLLERLKGNYDLDFETKVASGGAQIKGAGGRAVATILKNFGETRPFLKEGGRTNRGGQGDTRPLFKSLAALELESLSQEERNEVLTSFQSFLVERVKDFHNRQKLKLVFDPKLSTWQIIHDLFESSNSEGKAGYVAQHLVGAKLRLRFPPDVEVSNESASTADKPTNRSGDFTIGTTVFHVTVSPMEGVYKKCQENIRDGLKVYLIVPDAKLAAARQLGEQYCNGQIAVESLESFVSQNIEEISVFAADKLKYSLVNERRDYK